MTKKIYLFCPSIQDGGLEKSLSIYANFLASNFETILITNTFNKKRLKTINKNVKIIHTSEIKDDPMKRKPDIKLAKKLLNWNPKTSIIDGLDLTIDYFQKIQNKYGN